MKTLLCFLAAILAGVLAAPANLWAQDRNPGSQLAIPNVKHFPPGRVDWSYDRNRLTDLSNDTKRAAMGRINASFALRLPGEELVDTVHLNAALLDLPTDSPMTGASLGVPRQIAHLKLLIEKREYVLFVGDVAYDSRKNLRHVTAAVLNVPDGYARFTVDDRAGLIAGTIKTPEKTYRIVPYDNGGQLVYNLNAAGREFGSRYPQVTSRRPASPAVQALEERHRLAELLGDVQPWHVNFSTNDFMATLVGGEIGQLNVDSITSEDIRDLLLRLQPLTRARGIENFKIEEVTSAGADVAGRRSVRFRQVIQGLAIAFDQEIVVDGSGRIERLQVAIVDEAKAQGAPAIAQDIAFEKAQQAVRQKLAAGPLEVSSTDTRPELSYHILNDSLELAPVWRFLVRAKRQEHYVDVNGYTGEAVTWAAEKSFEHDIYGTTSGSPDEGSDPGTVRIIREDEGFNECAAPNPSDCDLPKYYMPARIIGVLEYLWVQSRGTDTSLCCAGVGTPPDQVYPTWTDKVLDVIVDTPEATGGAGLYRGSTQSILFPPGPPYFSTSVDIVVHETMHAYINRYNRSFSVDPRDNSAALNEGMADAMSGLFSEMQKNNPNFTDPTPQPNDDAIGHPWVMGDSPSAAVHVFDQRRLFETVNWSVFENGGEHDRGGAIGHFYYRLQATHAVSDLRLMEFMLQVATRVRDPNADGYGLNDFYNAMIDSIEPGESALLNAINDIWDAMTPPGGGGGNPPAAPPWVAGVGTGCVSGFSTFAVSWPASAGADGYRGWGSSPFGYEYLGSTAGPVGHVWTNYSWDFRASAYNAYGESSLSPTGFSVTHSQCF